MSTTGEKTLPATLPRSEVHPPKWGDAETLEQRYTSLAPCCGGDHSPGPTGPPHPALGACVSGGETIGVASAVLILPEVRVRRGVARSEQEPM